MNKITKQRPSAAGFYLCEYEVGKWCRVITMWNKFPGTLWWCAAHRLKMKFQGDTRYDDLDSTWDIDNIEDGYRWAKVDTPDMGNL